ncbi:MAG: ribonuclease III family protein [Armatimonadota bacterium]
MSEPAREAFGAAWGFPPESPWLERALTHRSADAEQGRVAERLEFLGDAVVGATVAKALYERMPGDVDEGALTRARVAVIRRETLADAARRLGLDGLVAIGGNERKWRRNEQDRLLADTYEAVVGALQCAVGSAGAEAFVRRTLADAIERAAQERPGPDPKTEFQERAQALGWPTPIYRIVAHQTDGVAHRVRAEALVGEEVLGTGVGPNRRGAEREAALAALDKLAGLAGKDGLQ